MSVTVRAPGKLVMWGEYAVLAGAPAAVMAVDRWATVTLTWAESNSTEHPETVWRISAQGFNGPAHTTVSDKFVSSTTAAILNANMSALGFETYPLPFKIHTDTSAFHSGGNKLGLGSSAASSTATYVALCQMLDQTATLEQAIAIHRRFQGGRGSGMDVAAAWFGGLVQFQDGQALPMDWRSDLHWLPIWSGQSASTEQHLDQFALYRKRSQQASLNSLAEASAQLFNAFTLDTISQYTDALKALDQDAQLGIYSKTHRALDKLARNSDMVYKPCGAGGGDFGIALGNASQVAAFQETITELNYQVIPLETATHGVNVE